jgi:hypothetical protein
MPRQHDVGLQLRGARRRGIEVVDLEPEQDTVAVRLVVAIAEGTVVVTTSNACSCITSRSPWTSRSYSGPPWSLRHPRSR